MQWWKQKEVESVLIALHDYQDGDERIIEAKEMELNNLTENDVYEQVEDCGQKVLTCIWAITEKENLQWTGTLNQLTFRGCIFVRR